uniref:hypothetical protein n=1 Tax=uncultured Sphingomonas sp. TaxID=158754 RepID=UPI0035CAA4F3
MSSRLAIHRFAVTGVAAGEHADRGRLSTALATIGTDRLGAAVENALGDFGNDDPRVIVLRRLELRHDQARIDDRDALIATIAEGVAAAIVRLAHEPAAGELIVFPSAAHQLGAFLAALVRGEAWRGWWFRDFDGVRMLSVSAAIRTVFGRDRVQGFAALRSLAPATLGDVLGGLNEADAAAMAAGLEADATVGGEAAAWADLFAAPAPPATLQPAAARLWLLAFTTPGGSGRAARGAFAALRVREKLATIAPETLTELCERGAVTELASLLPDLDQRDIAHLLALPPETVAAAARDPRRPDDDSAGGHTPFGGILLLWPHLPETPEPLPPGIALLALAAVLGPRRAEFAIGDPVLRAAFGIPSHTRRADLGADRWPRSGWRRRRMRGGSTARLPEDLHDPAIVALGVAAAATFARRLPGFTRSSLPFLVANLLDINANVTIGEGMIRARIHRPPLDVLLGMSGLADRTDLLPDGRRLVLARAS